MADAYNTISAALEQLIAQEFSSESIIILHDKLHESRGHEGNEVGISPIRQGPRTSNGAVKETYVLVQFYMLWDKTIDPTDQVDPRIITGMADRFERKCESVQASTPGTTEVWFFEITGIEYPDDPTGNKSRFHATVRAVGDNTALTQR